VIGADLCPAREYPICAASCCRSAAPCATQIWAICTP